MVMKRKMWSAWLMVLCALIVFMTLLTVRPQVTYACSCAVPASPLEAMEQSAAVFEGTVVSIKEKFKIMQSSADPVQATFQVGARWKGEVGEKVTVTTALSGASCGFEFTKGERYIVYAGGEEAAGEGGTAKLTVSLCSRTALFSGAEEDLNELGAGMSGARPRSRPGSLMIQGRSLVTTQPQQTLQFLKITQHPSLKPHLHLGCHTPEQEPES